MTLDPKGAGLDELFGYSDGCFELSYSILAVCSSPFSSLELIDLEEDMIVWFGALKVVQKVSDVFSIISKAAVHKFFYQLWQVAF